MWLEPEIRESIRRQQRADDRFVGFLIASLIGTCIVLGVVLFVMFRQVSG